MNGSQTKDVSPTRPVAKQRIEATITIKRGCGAEVSIGVLLDGDWDKDEHRLKLLAWSALCGAAANGIIPHKDPVTFFDRHAVDQHLAGIGEAMERIKAKTAAVLE